MRLDEAPNSTLIKCKLPVVGGSYSNPRCHVAAEVLPLIPYSFDVGRGAAAAGEPATGRRPSQSHARELVERWQIYWRAPYPRRKGRQSPDQNFINSEQTL